MQDFFDLQAGVVSRAQLLESGVRANDIRRLLRRRDLVVVHPGVYVNHTGPLTWVQRAWAAVLACWPAALCDESAMRAAEGPGRQGREERRIHVAIDRHRHRSAPVGVRVHRMEHLESRALWNTTPPRLRYEDAALDVAMREQTQFGAIAVLADAVQGRRTTAARILASLDERPRGRMRQWLQAVLADIAAGTNSVLEHGYLTRVERAHRLPRATRQKPDPSGTKLLYRDVEYEALIIELDGRLFHNSARGRDRDFDRDLDAAVDGRGTVRLSWGQVFDRGCRTAGQVGRLLQKRGWTGSPHPCGPDCPVRGG